MRAPEFWLRKSGLAWLLVPLGRIYGAATAARLARTRPWRAPVPVICIGNLVAGGAGKTPVALAMGERLCSRGVAVHFLSRGYGGQESGPLRVDPELHDARAVGDEPLLLAQVAPTWVSRDRVAGAKAAVDAGAGALILDDGFQNPSLVKDISLLVVDGGYGFGNEHLLPAGPLREPVDTGLARADAVVILGRDAAGVAARVARSPHSPPILHAHIRPALDCEGVSGRKVLAFAGIARPEKFFATLRDLGCNVVETRPFPDHYRFSARDIDRLLVDAGRLGALPVTTAKDEARLPSDARAQVRVLTITLDWEEETIIDDLFRSLPVIE